MKMVNEPWLKTTNDFALLGIKFLYLSNAGAIVAILANLDNFVDEDDYPIVAYTFSLFVSGLIFAWLCNLAGYLMYRKLFIVEQNNYSPKSVKSFGILAITSAIISFGFFSYGAYQALEVIESAL